MYKIRPLFEKYQKELVAFANTQYGRDFVSRFGTQYKQQIVKVTPDGIHERLDKNLFGATFHPRSPYINHFTDVLTSIDCMHADMPEILKTISPKERSLVIPHFMGETKLLEHKLPMIMHSTLTVNPNAHTESTSVDGRVGIDGDNTWANMRAGAGNIAFDAEVSSDYFVLISCNSTSSHFNSIYRGVYLFDTSSLTASAVISGGVISLYGKGTGGTLATAAQKAIGFVAVSPATNTALVNADYGTFGTTRYVDTDFAFASWGSTAYNDNTLNATGLAAISKTGITKIGTRMGGDIDNSAPTWADSAYCQAGTYFADNGSNKPKLVVTYTLPAAFFTMF